MTDDRANPAPGTPDHTLRRRLDAFARRFTETLDRLLTPNDAIPEALREAVRYAALGPGKRIRPYLTVRCCELVGGAESDAWHAAAAVECVHCFSLVHDDLPAMDDDDLRRGRPTCHKKFGEGVAVLAGDTLLTLAFELLAGQSLDPEQTVRMVGELAAATGWAGMIAGQAADIFGQTCAPDLERTRYIHSRKTARLFAAACRLGAMAGGGKEQQVTALGRFGESLGRAFQIADDLLDVTSTAEVLGKEVGKDTRAGKQTFPRSVGLEESRREASRAANEASAALSPFGGHAEDLHALARYATTRNY